MNFIRNRNFRAGPQTSLEGFICPQNSDKKQKIKVFGRSVGGRLVTFCFSLLLVIRFCKEEEVISLIGTNEELIEFILLYLPWQLYQPFLWEAKKTCNM